MQGLLSSSRQNFYDSVLVTPMGQLRQAGRLIPTDTSAAHALVSNVTPENNSEQNERTVYDIYLQTIAQEIFEFTAEQYETLYDIALQSPASGGRAVYWARVMLELDVEDAVSQNRFAKPKHINLSVSNHKGKLSPNPSKEFSNYRISIYKGENAHLQIYNLIGTQLNEYKLSEGFNLIKIATKEFENGIYICKLIINGKQTEQAKLAVLH